MIFYKITDILKYHRKKNTASYISYTATDWFPSKHNESSDTCIYSARNFESYERRVTRIISIVACKSNDKTEKLLKEERFVCKIK